MIADLIETTILVLTLAIIARAILSWFMRDPRNPVWEFVTAITDPILNPIRSVMPRGIMIDLSPLIAILLLNLLIRPLLVSLAEGF